MNDIIAMCLIVIILAISGIIIIMYLLKKVFNTLVSFFGSVIALVALTISFFVTITASDKAFEKVPYNDTPNETYEISNVSDIPFCQTGEENTVSILLTDGQMKSFKYDDFEIVKDSKENKAEIYNCGGDAEWFAHHKTKIIIYTKSK